MNVCNNLNFNSRRSRSNARAYLLVWTTFEIEICLYSNVIPCKTLSTFLARPTVHLGKITAIVPVLHPVIINVPPF